MSNYKVELYQNYSQEFRLAFEIDSDLSPADLENAVLEIVQDWRLGRPIDNQELVDALSGLGVVDEGSVETEESELEESGQVESNGVYEV